MGHIPRQLHYKLMSYSIISASTEYYWLEDSLEGMNGCGFL